MNKEKTGGAAFPTNQNGQLHHSCTQDGMTLLDYFAAKMQDIHAGNGIPTNEVRTKEIAKLSYNMAAAMIEERKKYI